MLSVFSKKNIQQEIETSGNEDNISLGTQSDIILSPAQEFVRKYSNEYDNMKNPRPFNDNDVTFTSHPLSESKKTFLKYC